MSETPLHVQVAEALGWTGLKSYPSGLWVGVPKEGIGPQPGMSAHDTIEVPRFDLSFCASGPLIQKHGIGLLHQETEWIAFLESPQGHGFVNDVAIDIGISDLGAGATPTEAVCHLILELHKQGKLKA